MFYVVTFVALWILIIFLYITEVSLYWKVSIVVMIMVSYGYYIGYLSRLGEKQWVGSHSIETIELGRHKAAEQARALLHEQILFEDFTEEFGESRDPEIRKLNGLLSALFEHSPYNDGSERDQIERQICRLERTTAVNG